MGVLVQCLRLRGGRKGLGVGRQEGREGREGQAAAPWPLWQSCAEVVLALASTEAAAMQLVQEEGVSVLINVWSHAADADVKSRVLDIFARLAASSKVKASLVRAPGLREALMSGLGAEELQERALVLLFACAHSGNSTPPVFRSWQHDELASIARAVRACTFRGCVHVLGRAAMFLGDMLLSSAAIAAHAAGLPAFVAELCAAMEGCKHAEEVAALTRVLACASAASVSKSVLVSVRDTVRASVADCASRACSDGRIVDHALVLLRNTGSSDLECLTFAARHLAPLVDKEGHTGSYRSLGLLCRLISGADDARAAVLAVGGEEVLLDFLCADGKRGAGAGGVRGDLARNMVASALMTAIHRRLLHGEYEPGGRRGGGEGREMPQKASPWYAADANSRKGNRKEGGSSSDAKADRMLGALVESVENFAGEHVGCSGVLAQSTGAGAKITSARGRNQKVHSLTHEERNAAARRLLQDDHNAASSAVWLKAIGSTRVLEVLRSDTEQHLDKCVLAQSPEAYAHSTHLALALLCMQRVVTTMTEAAAQCCACSSAAAAGVSSICQQCPALATAIKQLPLKRVLQLVVVASPEVQPAARAYLVALSAANAGAERMLKNGVEKVLAELLHSGESRLTSAAFSAVAEDFLAILDNICAASCGGRAAHHFALDTFLVQALNKIVGNTTIVHACTTKAASVLLSLAQHGQGAAYKYLAASVPALVRLAQESEDSRLCCTVLQTLALLLTDSTCLESFNRHHGNI